MPRMDGFGVIDAIRGESHNRSVPDPGADHRIGRGAEGAGAPGGATGWIVKPFEDAAIVSVRAARHRDERLT